MSDWHSPRDPSARPTGSQPWPASGQLSSGQALPGASGGWGPPATPPPSPAPQRSPGGGGDGGFAMSSLLVAAVVGLVVGAVGFFALAPSDAAPGSGGGSESTVTTSPGAGGTEGEAAAAGQAATPEEQVVYDLAAAFTDEDCAAIMELTEISIWGDLFKGITGEYRSVADEAEALSQCEAGFASGDLGPVRVYQTSILESVGQDGANVAVQASGWGSSNTVQVRQEDGVWRAFYMSYDSDVVERGAAEVERTEARPVGEPTEPPTGNATFDEIAQNCHGGSMVACDDLYWVAPRGSDYELYGITCGGRRGGVFAGGFCERDFNRQLDD